MAIALDNVFRDGTILVVESGVFSILLSAINQILILCIIPFVSKRKI